MKTAAPVITRARARRLAGAGGASIPTPCYWLITTFGGMIVID
jgi:hypothetical protein